MTTVATVLNLCRHQDGVTEGPGINEVLYNDWFYGHHVQGPAYKWCATFVSWVMAHSGITGIRTSRAFSLADQPGGEWHDGSQGIVPGDILVYDFGGFGHCGITEVVRIGAATVWEGNTATASDTDGGHVMPRLRHVPGNIIGYLRPPYTPPPTPSPGGKKVPMIYATEDDPGQVYESESGVTIINNEDSGALRGAGVPLAKVSYGLWDHMREIAING